MLVFSKEKFNVATLVECWYVPKQRWPDAQTRHISVDTYWHVLGRTCTGTFPHTCHVPVPLAPAYFHSRKTPSGCTRHFMMYPTRKSFLLLVLPKLHFKNLDQNTLKYPSSQKERKRWDGCGLPEFGSLRFPYLLDLNGSQKVITPW